MKKIILIISIAIYLGAVMVLSSCEKRTSAWHNMDVAEDLMRSQPDSALTILNLIDTESLGGDEERARFALLKSIALDKNYIDTTSFDVLQPAIDYYIRKGTPDEKMRTYYYQGRIYQNRHEMDSALQCFMKGHEYKGSITDTYTYANLLVAEGSIKNSVYKVADYISNNLEAAPLYQQLGIKRHQLKCLENALAGCIDDDNRERADSIYNICRSIIVADSLLIAEFLPYDLSYQISMGSNDSIKKILHLYENSHLLDDEAKIMTSMACLKIGDVKKASRIFNSIRITELKDTFNYMVVKAQVCEANGNLAESLRTYKQFYSDLDSIHQDIFLHDLAFMQERHNIEKANLKRINERNRIIGLVITIALVLVIIIGVISYRIKSTKAAALIKDSENERLKIEQDHLIQKNENLKLERENEILARKKIEVEGENMKLRISELEDEVCQLKNLVTEQKDMPLPVQNAIKERIEMLNALFASQIAEKETYTKQYDEWRDKILEDRQAFMDSTRLAFTASHPNFIEYLKQRGLTTSEINYTCLYALGLRGKEVGEYIQLKRHYHISSEIRKKLGLNEHQTNIGLHVRQLMKKL